jgi:hypothetical protein
MVFQYSKPRRLPENKFSQRVYDRTTKQGYIHILTLQQVSAQVRRGIKWDLDSDDLLRAQQRMAVSTSEGLLPKQQGVLPDL